ncbi:hypothetical protein Ahy_A09g045470 [Arachis hypogaea]|uniref:Aminotransferase-like plant mobile domain-containing protein n=1 Tax=Arachis hypogaea TaxID=3818 RepID=A0A445BMD7_ARAHY|nr:hypothetical protein Ahy_A09g045470 [Arachis hypogaea]
MRRQQGMRLDERYVPYLQMAGLYHLTRLNDRWFRLDEPLGGCPAWVWFQELLGVVPHANQIQKIAMNCTWFQETFGECPARADEEIVRRFARAYIMMLLGTQLFADKFDNRIHIRWLPYVARLEEMGGFSWRSAALAWSAGYDEFSWPLASRWSGHNPSSSEKGPRVQMWMLRIDMLQSRDFIWMPYSSPDVLQVVHLEVLEPRHTSGIRLTRCYRSSAEYSHVLNIDFLMSKDGRGGDHWFPYSLQFWHLHWENRVDHVLRFDVVADPGP